MKFTRVHLAAILLAGAMILCGCAAHRENRRVEGALRDYYDGNYQRAAERLRPLADKTNENFVLNNVRLGSVALVDYDLDQAENSFLRAYEVLNSVGVNDGGRSLGAVLVDEKIRIWKGEPFERAMANFYLGCVYYIRHDYNNARAAFENALFKLRDYRDSKDSADYSEQESNFAAALIMLGRCWQKLGRDDLAKANFDRVAELRQDLRGLADAQRHAEANLLLVIDFGYGPQKVTDFDGSIAAFAPPPSAAGMIPRPRVRIDGRIVETSEVNRPSFDLLAMAQDRRWQSIDTIRTVKSGIGTGLLLGGAYMGYKGLNDHDGDDLGVAAALVGAGLLLKATSQADVRQWEMLPRTTFILPLKVAPGRHDIVVDFPNADGLQQTWHDIEVPQSGEATYYFRMQRWNSGPFDWPPPAMAHQGAAPEPQATSR